MSKQEELVSTIIDALDELNADDPAADRLASYLYVADGRISGYINQFKVLLSNIEDSQFSSQQKQTFRQEAGKLLEQIAYLSFKGLRGASVFKSFQSAGPQYDLLVAGDDSDWMAISKVFYINMSNRDILIEAKARRGKVDDQDFARLCSLMELNISTASLGIFFTLSGATGFPDSNAARQRCLRDAKLRQVLFYNRTGKMIIVFTKEDIFSLAENASLTQLIIRKIRDLRENTGRPVPTIDIQEIDLPEHLQSLIF